MTLKSQVDERLVERFVELMAEFEPGRVALFVDVIGSDSNVSKLLAICEKFSLTEASSLLLERQGNVTAAYDLLLGQLQLRIGHLFETMEEGVVGERWTLFHSASQLVIEFCQRHSISMTEDDREKIWLTLLDELLQPQRSVRANQPANIHSILTGIFTRFIDGLHWW